LDHGYGNGVGMAIAAEHMADRFNKPGYDLVDPYIYAIVTDGDLMEGVSSEAASLAGHLRLGRLIYLYDDNHISIDGSTDLAFTEERMARFEAYGWHVQIVSESNDVEILDTAIQKAKSDPRPSIIAVRTHIGYGLPTRQDTPKAHGEPPGDEELSGAKKNLNWPLAPSFYVPDDVLDFYRQSVDRGEKLEIAWREKLKAYQNGYPELHAELARRLSGKLPPGWDTELGVFVPDEKGMATRNASGRVLNELAARIPELIGGSADLAPSNKTWINDSPSFQKDAHDGRNINFGVREHGMGAIVNGMSVFGGVIPYGGTFLVFSDYMRGALRLSALSHYPSIWVFTHDSIGVGEDGPTHQPVEHLAALRAIPGLVVIRPGDSNEVGEAWKIAIERRDGPTVLVFSRQNVPILDRSIYSPAEGLKKGAYVLADLGDGEPELVLISSGTEVSLIVEAGKRLVKDGLSVRLVSIPSWELFEAQDKSYQDSVLLPHVQARLAVEAGISQGWHKWVGDGGEIIAVDRYGASAPYNEIYKQFGLTPENIVEKARSLLS